MQERLVNRDEYGVRYTVFSMNYLNQDLVDELWYGPQAKDLTYIEVEKDVRAEVTAYVDAEIEEGTLDESERYDEIEYRVEREMENVQIEEPTIEGEYEGVQYHISWLGGAPMLWVFQSPLIGKFALCSPCCPGSTDGDSEGEYEGYDIPSTWKESF